MEKKCFHILKPLSSKNEGDCSQGLDFLIEKSQKTEQCPIELLQSEASNGSVLGKCLLSMQSRFFGLLPIFKCYS